MNQSVGGAPYVGVAANGSDSVALSPMVVNAELVKQAAVKKTHILLELSEEQKLKLTSYLQGRLAAGVTARDRRLTRYVKIDRLISTWQKLNPEDSERERIEDNTGRQAAIPMNLPILASSLADMSSYFAEALAPISNPFFSADGDEKIQELLKKFNRDAAARNYFGELNLTIRSLLKYNLGGFRLDWDTGERFGRKEGSPGNHYKSLDLYNTLWDPSIRQPTDVAGKGEWAATVTLENRLELMRYAMSGEWVCLEDVVSKGVESGSKTKYYREPAVTAQMGEEGLDSRTSNAKGSSLNWDSYGLGLASDLGPEVDGFEVVDMVACLIPCQFGLLTQAEEKELEGRGIVSDMFLEYWRFKIVNDRVVDAAPIMDRTAYLDGEKAELPFYLSFMTRDQLKEAQRSAMELQKGFQRFGSAMYNIYIAGMRSNVWGLKVADPSAIDTSMIKNGEVTGVILSKQQGRDVRTALADVSTNAGVSDALSGVESSLGLRDRFFPSQNMPNAVAGIDRAVKSQVTQVVQGSTRAVRTVLRVLDSTLMLPSRMGGYRNLKLYDKDGITELTDEDVAKLMGSGIESMEAERVSEILWQLLYAIIQNQESMQVFSIPQILSYLGRVGNLSVDLGAFAKEPPAQPAATPEAQPGAAPQPAQ